MYLFSVQVESCISYDASENGFLNVKWEEEVCSNNLLYTCMSNYNYYKMKLDAS